MKKISFVVLAMAAGSFIGYLYHVRAGYCCPANRFYRSSRA